MGSNWESWKGDHFREHRDGWSRNWKVGNGEISREHRDGWSQNWKVGNGENSESIVMDGVKIGKLETVNIPRAS